MKKPALRRASKSTALFLIAAGLFVAGMVGSTFAYFDAQDDNTGTFPAGYVALPLTVTTLGSLTGPIQTIKWAQPTTTGVNNYELRLTNMGAAAVACPASQVTTATVTALTTTAGGTIKTTTAAGVIVTTPQTYPETVGTLAAPALTAPATISASDNGSFVCFQVAAANSIGGWYSPPGNANATAFRVGLWPNSAALANHGTNNSLNAGDTVVLTYNQNIATTGSAIRVCGFTSGVLIIGDTNNCTSASDGYTIGKITGLTMARNLTFTNSSISSSGNTLATVVITGATGATTVGAESGAGTYSSATTNSGVTTPGSPSLPPCTLSGCSVAISGHF